MPSHTFAVTFSDDALDVLTHCEQMLRDASEWVNSGDWMDQFDIEPATQKALHFFDERTKALAGMDRSLYYCVFRLISLAAPGGGMEVYAYGESDIFWRVSHGLHGGMVFHAKYYGSHRLPTGDWSLHT